jgi:hypothetical protein
VKLTDIIEADYHSDERHREFFKSAIGESFHFWVVFQTWMKANKGVKTYQDAVNEYNRIMREKKEGKKYPIWPQFKYNQYMRDFFADNPKATREQCLACWKVKRETNGIYEKGDLETATK